ncbi:ATP-binding protein [Pseudonocardia sp. CA-107938]|uniref:ATP-binding protein n=1 Tax=Pseudonocardia sp. CA-107938 TaxID=3240021 RepID=UPI003D919EB6
MDLFAPEHIVGVFRGFSESGMEFHADLVMPYRDEFQSTPMHGQFVLVQLEHNREAVFGRITTIAAQGRLVSPIGEDYAVRAVRDQREIPEELRDQYLKYKVNIRVLGVLRQEGDKLLFVPSHRRLPHVGSPVAFLSPDVLAEVANANDPDPEAAEIGYLAFGEFVYCGADPRADIESWVVPKAPVIAPKFPIDKMISRRSFVFARAGFGKSNLVKLLFSALYSTANGPTVPRRDGGRAPVGTVIFDPDGEYFWPDPRGNPGLCDVEALQDRLVVFTNRQAPSETYGSFVIGGIKLDLRQLTAAKVLGIALSAERQDQQNVAKLKGLNAGKWRELVDLVAGSSLGDLYADPARFKAIVGFGPGQDAEVNAAISNMSRVVRELHDPSSQLLRALVQALRDGKLCVVDISQMRGPQGLRLAGIVLSHIFEHNQEQFTASRPRTIPTIAVIEEAQSVLGGGSEKEDGPFVSWVKEGRKYDLGALMITQQPGSIPAELLSQGDNFFVFHLLSQGDLASLKRANAHFSDDLLASLLNEPLVGHGVFWSSAPGTDRHARPYPLSIRALNFSRSHVLRDPGYRGQALDVYASRVRAEYEAAVAAAIADGGPVEASAASGASDVDVEAAYRRVVINALAQDQSFWRQLESDSGIKWGTVQGIMSKSAPSVIEKPFDWAYGVVPQAMDEVTAARGRRWRKERREDRKVWFVLEPLPTVNPAADPANDGDEEPPF